jgi:hypothetical protein
MKHNVIELATLVFYKGALPQTMALRDCSLPMPRAVPGVFPALYGSQGKRDGFVAASEYAKKQQLQFTVIDFCVAVELKRSLLKIQPDTLASQDFLDFTQMSRHMDEHVKSWMRSQLHLIKESSELLDTLKPIHAVMQQPELMGYLLKHPSCHHLKVAVCPTQTLIADDPLNVGNVALRHWGAITEATCRLDPAVRVTLEPPVEA